MESYKTENPNTESKEPDLAEEENPDENLKSGPIAQKRSRLSREEIQEFKIAFEICTEEQESKESLHKDLLPDLFLTLGYSLGPHTLQTVLSGCRVDSDGYLSLEDLLEAYDQWRHEEIPPEDIESMRKIFTLLKVTPDHVSSGLDQADREMNESYIDDVTMKALLRQVCHDPDISLETARGVIAEVDRNGSGTIDFQDFQRLMRLEL